MKLLFILLSFIYLHPLTAPLPVNSIKYHSIKTDDTKNNPDEDKFPVPPESLSRLFYVQRTSNANTIMYELNEDKAGHLNEDQPVHVYWLKYADKGQKEELNYIQRKFAYGIITKPLSNNEYDIRFVSYKKFPLSLMKGGDGKYHIFATVAQKQMILSRIFLKIEGGSFWLPNVVYVELKGVDPLTGKEIVERFKP